MKLDGAFLESLSRLKLSMGFRTSMNLSGNRKSFRKGSSAEFSDFREYMPGDDIRRIDWNAYGRLDRLYVKEYMEEKEATVSILLDTSASMDYGEKKKGELAERLAAALAYLGLCGMDRVFVYEMRRMESPFQARGGKRAFPLLEDWLNRLSFDGVTDVCGAVRKLPSMGAGVTVVISDFLQEEFVDEDGDAAAQLLRFLRYRRQKAVFLQVLAREEIAVPMTGAANLIDMEDKSSLRLTLDVSGRQTYENALARFTEGLRAACAKAGAAYALCNTQTDFQKMIFQDLRMLYDI